MFHLNKSPSNGILKTGLWFDSTAIMRNWQLLLYLCQMQRLEMGKYKLETFFGQYIKTLLTKTIY